MFLLILFTFCNLVLLKIKNKLEIRFYYWPGKIKYHVKTNFDIKRTQLSLFENTKGLNYTHFKFIEVYQVLINFYK